MLYITIILFMLHTSQCDDYIEREKVKWCKPLRRRNPPGDMVALASFPGSGSTWLRYLLQQATGVETGSVYQDEDLKRNGFPAETVSDGSVLVVKTHEKYPNTKIKFKSAILLIRNPRDTILSGYHYALKGHTSAAPRSAFRMIPRIHRIIRPKRKAAPQLPLADMGWRNFAPETMAQWETFYKSWLTSFRGPIHIVFYETLVKDTRRVLRGVLKFIRFKVSRSDINCTLERREGIFRRVHKYDNFDPFTKLMSQKIGLAYDRILALVKSTKNAHKTNEVTIKRHNTQPTNKTYKGVRMFKKLTYDGQSCSSDSDMNEYGLMLDFLLDNKEQKNALHFTAHKKNTDKETEDNVIKGGFIAKQLSQPGNSKRNN